MMVPLFLRRVAWVVALLGSAAQDAFAVQSVHDHFSVSSAAPIISAPVVPGERLSDWLLRNASPVDETGVLHWWVPAERGPQQRLRDAVLQASQTTAGLAELIQSLPVTGRVVVASADARWLQGTPAQDPVLQDGHSVHVYARPRTVAVVGADGKVCLVRHRAGTSVQGYLQACGGGGAGVDWVWGVQSDARVHKMGVARWNADHQVEAAPGAWLWAPQRGAVGDSASDNLARFLATQPPAEHVWPDQLVLETVTGAVSAPNPVRVQYTASDWGDVGLLQTPTARMDPAGTVRTHFSAVYPYSRGTVMLQPLGWLEAGFRYTDMANVLYGPAIAGSQTLKDKSIDIKVRLRQESANGPQIALGLRDIGGTGLFAGEYLVANKRWGGWDASVGMGWGYVGGRGDIGAPLAFLGDGFKQRTLSTGGSGGTTNDQSYFRGNAALFGGVQWSSPTGQWVLKTEVDGNDYRVEPSGTTQTQNSPLNLGAVYRYSPYVDLTAGWERGNRAMLGLTLHFGLNQLETPKVLDPALAGPQVGVVAPTVSTEVSGAWAPAAAAELARHTGWRVLSIAPQGGRVHVHAVTDGAVFLQERVEKALRVLHQFAPASVRYFVLDLQERGLRQSHLEIDRTEWLANQTQGQAPSLKLPPVQVYAAQPGAKSVVQDDPPGAYRASPAGLSVELAPSYSQILGGPDGFLLFQAGVQVKWEQRLQANTWVGGSVDARVVDNYKGFKYDAPSNLPRVRTYMREYVTTSQLTVPVLQLTHVQDLGGGHYASVYGGLLETMYAGVGAEWLYRPWQGPVAVGVDVNRVRQRGFAQDFSMRDYEVNTGHATAHWDTGWNDVQLKLQVGQYLAGDVGATFDAKRVFPNGTAIGAWATKTNVSAAQFGEGSFDKGIYVTIPFDLLLPKSAPGTATAIWTPLTRDGGARLNRSVTLFDLTGQRDARAMSWLSDPTTRERNRFKTGKDLSAIQVDAPDLWTQSRQDLKGLGQRFAQVPASTWALGAGVVLAASLADAEVNQWAINNQGDSGDRMANLSNGIPVALALGSGALLTGIAGEGVADTARSAWMAAGATLGVNGLLKYSLGRVRPLEEKGTGFFSGGDANAVQSSFASNHVATAFALVTPFAQQYDQPGLYALAAASALGRIQQREHWLSDTVAGGILGYALGSLMSAQQAQRNKGWTVYATPQFIGASKAF